MVDGSAARVAVIVGGGALLVLLAGQVLRWATRMLAYAGIVLFVVLLAYATYELYAGWAGAAAESETTTAGANEIDPVESNGEYAVDGLSDEEFEAELDRLREPEAGDGSGPDPAPDREREPEYGSR